MIVLSKRYWAAILVLVLLAGMPAWLHAGSAMFRDDCANPARLRLPSRIPGTGLGTEKPRRYEGGIFQWTDGLVETNVRVHRPSRFRIVRSFGPDEFYFDPKRFYVGNPFPNDVVTKRWLQVEGEELPYFTRYDPSEGAANLGSYMYIFDGRPIHDLFAESLASWVPQLVDGTHPVTLLLIDQSGDIEDIDAVMASSEAWLLDAWAYYASVCRPSDSPRPVQ